MKKRYMVFCSALLLSACGFQPMYGTTHFGAPSEEQVALEEKLSSIAIANIPNREGQYLRNLLIDRFHPNGKAQDSLYTLKVSNLKESITDLDITKESDATRAQLRIDANISLEDAKTGQTVLVRKLTGISSYNILTSEFATRVTEDNTRKNVLTDLARQIELQLGLYLGK